VIVIPTRMLMLPINCKVCHYYRCAEHNDYVRPTCIAIADWRINSAEITNTKVTKQRWVKCPLIELKGDEQQC
jgi:hypothetical protein